MQMPNTEKNYYSTQDLVEIVAYLRSPNGCMWDREQTHKSIRNNFIEETYEAVEAIDNGDLALLKEELGDVLLQIVLHSQMEAENDSFDLNDVADGVCKKLIWRHPHVFGNVKVNSSEQVLDVWEQAKKEQKQQKSVSESLKSVPAVFPALMRAQKLNKRAQKSSVLEALDEKTQVEQLCGKLHMLLGNTQGEKARLYGQILFEMAALAVTLKTDAEEALHHSSEEFISAFEKAENLQK